MGTKLSKEQVQQLIKDNDLKTAEDVQNVLKDLFKDTLQEMLEAEITDSLGYSKSDKTSKVTENRRNGHSKKSVRSEYGEIDLEVPRDRDGEFEPEVVKKRQKSVTGIEDQIVALYAKGVTTREIQDYLKQLYGLEISPTLVSTVTGKILPMVKEWQNRPLQAVYAVVFLDAVHFKVRQDGMIQKKAAYMAVGIDLEGQKDVLGMWVGETESSKFWLYVLNELRSRGVQDILIVSVDNLTGFSEAIGAAFPDTEIQKCIVHQVRNSIRYVSYKDLKKVTSDLKPIYQAASEKAGFEELQVFRAKWDKQYPLIGRSWEKNWPEISTFFKYSPEIRKLIYTTNTIESYHRQLRKVTKGKSIFPNDDALLKALYLATQDVMRKWNGRIHNWGQILLQLSIQFPNKITALL
jgi:transposase-like protein